MVICGKLVGAPCGKRMRFAGLDQFLAWLSLLSLFDSVHVRTRWVQIKTLAYFLHNHKVLKYNTSPRASKLN